jgi:phosphate butyryltransferase
MSNLGYDALTARLKKEKPRTLAVVAAHEKNVLQAVWQAAREKLAEPWLLGDRARMERLAVEQDIDLSALNIDHFEDDHKAALAAMERVRSGEVGVLMKGKISTPDLMRVGLKNGLRRPGRLLTHIVAYEHPRLSRMFLLTDSGVVTFPSLEQRVEIVRNGVEAMRALGVEKPRVAALSSTEKPDDNIPSSQDAAKLAEMNRAGGPLADCGIVDGPMDLLSAVDGQTARIKGLEGPVAGKADILHCPDVVSGNLMGKAIAFFSQKVRLGGCVVGGRVPVIMLSRASPADNKYCSLVLGLACSAV